ncbi:MAG: tRNA 2-thiouridine(34) synthase MnmA [Acidobacteria bacterium RIFCSPLOWO2_12_FULL_59_11]|nr:MAG: tRNA 2-thiouridine(34) synthase MnmA [Acidobacteria bacterium RIFCSPLOWO2_12_FULL_59_11]
MSGGVDSSTVAALLTRDHDVVGLTMQLWDQRRMAQADPCAPKAVHGRCCSTGDVYDARRVAEHLDFPFYVVNFQRQFEETVVRPFVSEYLEGRTPIPCTHCNNHVKFGELLRLARQIGADVLATGHYARVEFDAERGRYLLRKAVDETRDQSYFLWGLSQDQLGRSWFPLGSLRKPEVRELARQFALPVAEKPESHEICFVPDGNYARFLEAYQQDQGAQPADSGGEVVSTDGKVLGQHGGLYHYTVGQRKGLGVAVGNPLYVISLDPASRRVVVGDGDALLSRTCFVRDTNWIAVETPSGGLLVEAKIRHQHPPAPATLFVEGNGVRVEFDTPQRAVTPGQAAVFYQRDLVIGGGWISGAGG